MYPMSSSMSDVIESIIGLLGGRLGSGRRVAALSSVVAFVAVAFLVAGFFAVVLGFAFA